MVKSCVIKRVVQNAFIAFIQDLRRTAAQHNQLDKKIRLLSLIGPMISC